MRLEDPEVQLQIVLGNSAKQHELDKNILIECYLIE